MTVHSQDIVRRCPILVGRAQLVDDLKARAAAAERLELVEVEAGEGMGKTTLLAHACRALADGGVLALFADFAQRVGGARGADGGLALKSQRLSAYISLLRDLAEGFEPDAREPSFADDVRATVAAFGATLGESIVVIETVADDVGRAFSRRLAAAAAGRRVALVLDDFDRVEQDELGAWLAAVLRRSDLPGAVIVGRTGPRPAATPLAHPAAVLALGALTPPDVAEYLEQTVGSPPDREAAERIARWSGGHPLALKIAAAHIEDHGWESLDELERQEGPLADRLATEIEHRIDSLGDEDLRAALDVAAVVRVFDRKLVRALVADLRPEADDDLAERLEAHALVERLDDERFRLRSFLRPVLLRRLATRRTSRPGYDRTALKDLHACAHAYHEDELRKLLEDRAGYSGWAQLERRETWDQLLEYLHHAAHLSVEHARASFALVYFDAFWWWGAEAPFPLCDILVEQAPVILTGDDDGFVRAVRRFHESYPTGPAKPDAPTWGQVLEALEAIRSHAALDGDPQVLGQKNRHVRAITDVLLAQTHRYLSPDDPAADALLREARELFRSTAHDNWCLPWVSWHGADLALARAERATGFVAEERHARDAKRCAEEALAVAGDPAIADEDRDHEVLSNAHRVLGDLAWRRGDTEAAFERLAREAWHSYAFQAMPQPDDYTRGHLRAVIQRTVERIRQLAERDEARAVRQCVGLYEFWVPYWRALGAADVVPRFDVLVARRIWDDVGAAVVPVEPRRADMRERSAYVERVRAVVAARRDRVSARDGRGSAGREPEAGAAEGWHRPNSLSALADPVVDRELFEPRDHPVWPRAWRDAPTAWTELLEDENRHAEVFELLRRAILDLPSERRSVLERRDIAGWSAEDVSRELGISADDQTVMLHRARAAVQDALEPYFEYARL